MEIVAWHLAKFLPAKKEGFWVLQVNFVSQTNTMGRFLFITPDPRFSSVSRCRFLWHWVLFFSMPNSTRWPFQVGFSTSGGQIQSSRNPKLWWAGPSVICDTYHPHFDLLPTPPLSVLRSELEVTSWFLSQRRLPSPVGVSKGCLRDKRLPHPEVEALPGSPYLESQWGKQTLEWNGLWPRYGSALQPHFVTLRWQIRNIFSNLGKIEAS